MSPKKVYTLPLRFKASGLREYIRIPIKPNKDIVQFSSVRYLYLCGFVDVYFFAAPE